jgi:hypothetical protein
MGLLCSEPAITTKDEKPTSRVTDPDLAEAIQIIKNRK